MEIPINLGKISDYGLSPNEYVALYLIHTNNLENFDLDISRTLLKLESKEIIDSDHNIIVKLPEKLFGGADKVEDLESYWIEFKETYPKKDGVRRLHDSPSKCKAKYFKILKKDVKVHKDVIKGLKNENTLRENAEKRNEFFQAPKLMSTYLNNRSWEGYLEDDIEDFGSPRKDVI